LERERLTLRGDEDLDRDRLRDVDDGGDRDRDLLLDDDDEGGDRDRDLLLEDDDDDGGLLDDGGDLLDDGGDLLDDGERDLLRDSGDLSFLSLVDLSFEASFEGGACFVSRSDSESDESISLSLEVLRTSSTSSVGCLRWFLH